MFVPDNANVLVKVVAIFGVINRVRATTPCTVAHNMFCYSAVAHILTPSVNLALRPKSGFKNNVRLEPGSDSGRVQASERGPFTTLCGYVGRGQQGKIEGIRPPPTNSKNRLEPFCEMGCANFTPNVFAPGKRMSMEISVWVGLHA